MEVYPVNLRRCRCCGLRPPPLKPTFPPAAAVPVQVYDLLRSSFLTGAFPFAWNMFDVGEKSRQKVCKVTLQIIGPFFGPNAYKERIRWGSHLGSGIRGLHDSRRNKTSESGEIRLRWGFVYVAILRKRTHYGRRHANISACTKSKTPRQLSGSCTGPAECNNRQRVRKRAGVPGTVVCKWMRM
jgi:hypothetical protein